MELHDLKDYMDLSKGALDLFKSAYSLLPRGTQRDEIESKIKAAEEIMKRSDAKLAQDLGYQLCRCDFPPNPMLWREKERAFVCPAQGCGHRIKEYKRSDDEDAGSNYF